MSDSVQLWRAHIERLEVFRRAFHVIETLAADYTTGLETLRDEGYWLDDEILEMARLSALEDGAF